MWQRKQTIYLIVAVILTVICLCLQIGSFNLGGVDVARVYNLWYTDPIGKHHFDVWPLMAILLPTAALGTYTIFIFRNRKAQALFCVGHVAGNHAWGAVDFRPEWPAVLPAIALILYLLARRAIRADEKLVRSLDRIR